MKENRRFHAILPIVVAAIAAVATNPKANAAVNVGSSSWVWQSRLPQGDTLNAISWPTASTCFALGDLGSILVTTNGGTDWASQFSLTQSFQGENRGYFATESPGISPGNKEGSHGSR